MNFKEMEEEFNQLMKHGHELIEKLKGQQKEEFDIYEINFNGKTERYYRSKEEMTFDEAQELIKKAGKKPLTVSDLWQRDTNGIERWRYLKDAGCDDWVWCEEYSDIQAYFVDLLNGYVGTSIRTGSHLALCL